MQPLLGSISTPNLGIESASDFTLKVRQRQIAEKKKQTRWWSSRGCWGWKKLQSDVYCSTFAKKIVRRRVNGHVSSWCVYEESKTSSLLVLLLSYLYQAVWRCFTERRAAHQAAWLFLRCFHWSLSFPSGNFGAFQRALTPSSSVDVHCSLIDMRHGGPRWSFTAFFKWTVCDWEWHFEKM